MLSLRSRRLVAPSLQMGAGLVVFGIAGYVFVALTGRTLPKAEANLALAFYFVVNVAGPGVFAALEQVASRSTSRALAAGRPVGPELRKVLRAGAILVAVVTGLLVLLAPVLVGATLHGDWVVFAAVLTTPALNGALHLVRGQLAGSRRFGGYSAVLAIEGAARMVLCLGLAVAGADHAWVYAAAYQISTVVAVLAGLAWLRARRPAEPVEPVEPTAEDTTIGRSLAALSVATLFAQLLPNIAPLAVTSRLAEDSAVALAFGQAAVIARIPVLLFFPVLTMLLPSLTAAVTRGDLALFARRMRLLLAGIVGAGIPGVALFVAIGPWVLRTFLATPQPPDTGIMLLLGTSTVVLIAAYAVQPALVALGRDRVVTVGWVVGSVVTLGLALLLPDAVTAAAIGQLLGPGLTLLIVLHGLLRELRSDSRPAVATR
ncbi:MAG TPA: hypothetical protein VFV67_14095 [Actinophytocola sp.]|uniref:lipopolysaccharide biosynthesis protein n=1 Tax=Actinophytocola sp. TaxID=1872138 RepID=UPI002DBA55E7|nr:hypothetical protein [Actinophytocola sp.]HEU5471779.1 hypothetical protein [Actinophytocola sp.]